VIGAWCKLCLVADPAAIVLAVAVIAGAETIRPSRKLGLLAFGLAGIVGALALWTRHPAPEIPEDTPNFVIAAQQPDTVTIVELVDFECPFCRALQQQLVAALPRAPEPVHLVRKMVPLPQHKHALTAAVAWCCADAQGKGDAMADALFAADPKELTIAGCEKLAEKAGLDLDRYRAAMKAPATIETLKRHLLDAQAAQVDSLPTVYIGGERLMGASASVDDLVVLLDRAQDR